MELSYCSLVREFSNRKPLALPALESPSLVSRDRILLFIVPCNHADDPYCVHACASML